MLEAILGSRTRVRVLSALLGSGGGSMRFRRLVRAAGTSVSSVQRELERLEGIGLVISSKSDDARHLRINEAHPFVEPLRALLAAEQGAHYELVVLPTRELDPPVLGRLNPSVRRQAAAIAETCRAHGALKAAVVGSSAQPDPAIVPRDLDLLVRLADRPEGYADRYFGLLEDLGRIMGMPVEIIEEDAIENPLLRAEFEATQVVLYEVA